MTKIVGLDGKSVRNFNDWVKETFNGNFQQAIVGLVFGHAQVSREDQNDFLPRIPKDDQILATVMQTYYMAYPMYQDWVGQKQMQMEFMRQQEEAQREHESGSGSDAQQQGSELADPPGTVRGSQ